MDDLPPEVVSHILSYSHEDSAAALVTKRLVCQQWRGLIDTCTSIWARYSSLAALAPTAPSLLILPPLTTLRFRELSISDSKMTTAELEHRCSFMVRPEKVRLRSLFFVRLCSFSFFLSWQTNELDHNRSGW
jgi:hypothetical protein